MADRQDSRRVMTEGRDSQHQKAIDAWIASDLARRYDPTLAEPLPSDLLALLRD